MPMQPSLADEATGAVQVAVIGPALSGKASIINTLVGGAQDAAVAGLPVFCKFRSQISGQSLKYHVKVEFLTEDEIRHDIARYCEIVLGGEYRSEEAYNTFDVARQILRNVTNYRAKSVGFASKASLQRAFLEYLESLLDTQKIEEITAEITNNALQKLQSSKCNYHDTETLQWDTNRVLLEDFMDEWVGTGYELLIWPFVRSVDIYCKDMMENDLTIVKCPGSAKDVERQQKTMDEIMGQTEIVVEAVHYRDLYECQKIYRYCKYSDLLPRVRSIWVVTGDVIPNIDWEYGPGKAPPHGSIMNRGLDADDLEQRTKADNRCEIALRSFQLCRTELLDALQWTNSTSWGAQVDLSEQVLELAVEFRSKLHNRLCAKQALHMARLEFGLGADVPLFRVHHHVHAELLEGELSGKATKRVKHAGVRWDVRESGVPQFLEGFNKTLGLVRHGRTTRES